MFVEDRLTVSVLNSCHQNPAISKLKILHIGKYFSPFSGGLENYMRDAMVALRRRGIKSAALVHRHSWSLKTQDESIKLDGHHFHLVRTGRWAHFLYTPISPTLPWHLWRMLKTSRPDILHLHLPNPSVFWVLLLPSARHLPWVVHWHADVITAEQSWLVKLFYRLYQPFERAILKAADAVVVTSKPYLDSSEPLQQFKSKCHIVPLGVDVKRFRGTDKLAHGDQQGFPTRTSAALRILAVGRLTYYKGFNYLIEAAAKTPGVVVHIVGRGEQATRLQTLSASLNLQDRIIFHGVLSDMDLLQQMQECDCLCLPSIERTEAFGMVLLEAMYFGKATIVTRLPGSGMGWIVDDGITGIKVETANADALATTLIQLDNDREKLAEMGRRGKQKFTQQFEINHAVQGLVDIYHGLLPPNLACKTTQTTT